MVVEELTRLSRLDAISAKRKAAGLPDWRCSYSPSGAHHWINLTEKRECVGPGINAGIYDVGSTRWWACKYCAEITDKFSLSFKPRVAPFKVR